jgi:hypothetical protein
MESYRQHDCLSMSDDQIGLNAPSGNQCDNALGHAYREQSFGPLDPLFSKEEAALVAYEQASSKLTKAEERWCALRVALAYERELMQEVQLCRKRLN